jgi:isohexenylglutaconyl-CoA hydratase
VTIDAQAALAAGLGGMIAPDQAAIGQALAGVLGDIGRMEPQALAAVKRLVLNCATDPDVKVMDDAARDLVGLLRRPAARQGIAAFMAKRLPPWAEEEQEQLPADRKAAGV